jgi:hypothetical protein
MPLNVEVVNNFVAGWVKELLFTLLMVERSFSFRKPNKKIEILKKFKNRISKISNDIFRKEEKLSVHFSNSEKKSF